MSHILTDEDLFNAIMICVTIYAFWIAPYMSPKEIPGKENQNERNHRT